MDEVVVGAEVEQAIRKVRPWGVDAASGVESSPGRKDATAVRRFVQRAKQAGGELDGGWVPGPESPYDWAEEEG